MSVSEHNDMAEFIRKASDKKHYSFVLVFKRADISLEEIEKRLQNTFNDTTLMLAGSEKNHEK